MGKISYSKNILSFDDNDIECMRLDGVFNQDELKERILALLKDCLLYTSPSPRD